MKTFNVKKTERDEKTNYPIETKIIGSVTAYGSWLGDGGN
jgi:hypothetical protein